MGNARILVLMRCTAFKGLFWSLILVTGRCFDLIRVQWKWQLVFIGLRSLSGQIHVFLIKDNIMEFSTLQLSYTPNTCVYNVFMLRLKFLFFILYKRFLWNPPPVHRRPRSQIFLTSSGRRYDSITSHVLFSLWKFVCIGSPLVLVVWMLPLQLFPNDSWRNCCRVFCVCLCDPWFVLLYVGVWARSGACVLHVKPPVVSPWRLCRVGLFMSSLFDRGNLKKTAQ